MAATGTELGRKTVEADLVTIMGKEKPINVVELTKGDGTKVQAGLWMFKARIDNDPEDF